jgi:hypothetical protein
LLRKAEDADKNFGDSEASEASDAVLFRTLADKGWASEVTLPEFVDGTTQGKSSDAALGGHLADSAGESLNTSSSSGPVDRTTRGESNEALDFSLEH